MKRKAGFTLMESVIGVIILGILVSVGIPLYRKAVLRIEDKEAKAMLKLIQTTEKMIKLETGSYVSCTNTSQCNTNLRLNLPTSAWSYSVSASGNNFCAQAQGGGTGTWYINQNDGEADQNDGNAADPNDC